MKRAQWTALGLAGLLAGPASAREIWQDDLNAAQKAYEAGQCRPAIDRWRKVLALGGPPQVAGNLALCLLNLQEHEEALFAYKNWVEKDPAPPAPIRRERERNIARALQGGLVQCKNIACPDSLREVLLWGASYLGRPAPEMPPKGSPVQQVEPPPPPLVVKDPSVPPIAKIDPASPKVEPPKPQVWRSWWLWTTVGVAAAGGITTGLVLGLRSGPMDLLIRPPPPPGEPIYVGGP